MVKLKSTFLIALFLLIGFIFLIPTSTFASQARPRNINVNMVGPTTAVCETGDEIPADKRRGMDDHLGLNCMEVVPEIEDLFVDGVLTDVNVVSVELADGRLIDRQTQVGIVLIFGALLALTAFWMGTLHKINHPTLP